MGSASAELESAKYSSLLGLEYTQVNGKPKPAKLCVWAELRSAEALAGPKHSARLVTSCMPAS